MLGTHKLDIGCGDHELVVFNVFSHAFPPANQVPASVLTFLLQRNHELFVGSWAFHIDDDGDAGFFLRYHALGNGLTPQLFKFICDSMVAEVQAFDAALHAAGVHQVTS